MMKRSRPMLVFLSLVGVGTSMAILLVMSARSFGLSALTHKTTHFWLHTVAIQAKQTQNQDQGQNQDQNQMYETCIFGDSITSPLGNTFGDNVANFAIGGLSTSTLLTQLQRLKNAGTQCRYAIVAIGTNDACYGIADIEFMENLRQIISLLRYMGAERVKLVPAFYSTYEASLKPNMAGPLQRVDEINQLIDQVAELEQVAVVSTGLEHLYQKNTLRTELTSDGVHLNKKGQDIYRQFLTKILKSEEQ